MLAQHLNLWDLPGKVIPPDNWHLTIRFLGLVELSKRELLMSHLDQAPLGEPFDLTLGEMGAFPRSSRATVLWLGLKSGGDDLTQLHQTCEKVVQAAGFPAEERPYAPHLTLSTLRPVENVTALIDSYQPQPFRWHAPAVVLYESLPGPTYVPVEIFLIR